MQSISFHKQTPAAEPTDIMKNKVKNKIRWLRISYWVGAVVDGLYVIPMLVPRWGGALLGVEDFNPGGEARYTLAVGAALMLGWTAVLLWADRKPLERRGVLLLTIFPVKVCLDLASLYLVMYGILPLERLLLSKVDAVVLYGLFTYSYVNSRGDHA